MLKMMQLVRAMMRGEMEMEAVSTINSSARCRPVFARKSAIVTCNTCVHAAKREYMVFLCNNDITVTIRTEDEDSWSTKTIAVQKG